MLSKRSLLAGVGASLVGAAAARASGSGDVKAAADPAPLGFSRAGLDRFHGLLDGEVREGRLSGGVTMLVRHGQVVDLDVFGLRNVRTGEPMTRDSIFRLYSQTKLVTAVAMMTLYDEGKWRLDDPVTRFVPELGNLQVLKGADAQGKPLYEPARRPPTMREVMSHSAGFGLAVGASNDIEAKLFKEIYDGGASLPPDLRTVAIALSHAPLYYQPGTGWKYSIAPDLQAYIAEQITGLPYDEFLKRRIFGPLDMRDTGFQITPEQAKRIVGLYTLGPDKKILELLPEAGSLFPQDYTKSVRRYFSGTGGLVSTTDDFAHLCQMILNGGTFRGKRILSREAVRLMDTNQLAPTIKPAIPSEFDFAGGGMGWGLGPALVLDRAASGWKAAPGTMTWGGLGGTFFWIDPTNDIFFLGMIQRAAEVEPERNLIRVCNDAVYAAFDGG
jgi:CubicO group peptidase (beta-lactamase class C family)